MLRNQETKEVYTRSNTIVVNNELGLSPVITFHEQLATVDGVALDGRSGGVSKELTPEEMGTEFNLLDESGAVVGTMTYGLFATALASLYHHVADLEPWERDPSIQDPADEQPDTVIIEPGT